MEDTTYGIVSESRPMMQSASQNSYKKGNHPKVIRAIAQINKHNPNLNAIVELTLNERVHKHNQIESPFYALSC